MTVPNGPKPATGWPVVIFNHGYIPPAQYVTTERYVAYQDAFARAGYISFKSDYRGHGKSEGLARSQLQLGRLHRRRAQRAGLAEELQGRRPQPDRHVGAFDGRAGHAAGHGDLEGHQGRRDLVRHGRFRRRTS